MSFEVRNLISHKLENINDTDELESDILDLNQINFEDDETWLYNPKDYSNNENFGSFGNEQNHFDKFENMKDFNLKNINTQTFTRPKKKFQRLSIEKYNEELFGDNRETKISESLTTTKPLEFDLSASSNSYYFEKLSNNSIDETFLNMSPPSLVNSMCSSTFTNLMENSMIKNDPILKQICDTDFTASILSQCSEPSSLVQSINFNATVDDFLSSNQCDMMLKSIDLNSIDIKSSGDATYLRKETSTDNNEMDFEEYHDASSESNFERRRDLSKTLLRCQDGTFRKPNRLSSATFRKTDLNNRTSTLVRNHTYEIDPKDIEDAQNITLTDKTETLLNKSNSIENLNSRTLVKDSCNNNDVTYQLKDNNEIGTDDGRNGSGKSLDCSIGSADSLDRMSTLSSSSKGSSREAETIADKQEKELQAPMSTPKPNWTNKVLDRVMWDYDGYISPIAPSSKSDSGESSDEYKSVKSTLSKNSIDSNPVKQTRSLVSLQPSDVRKLKSMNTIVNQAGNLKVPMKYSAGNLPKIGAKLTHFKSGSAGSLNTNLNTMRPTLKGSYTSLKPVNSYLPVAPPIVAQSQEKDSTFVRPQNAPPVSKKNDGGFIKPSGPALRSNLPRPTSSTSIPRPVSKIPGPKRW